MELDFDEASQAYRWCAPIAGNEVEFSIAREQFETGSSIEELIGFIEGSRLRLLDQVLEELLEIKNEDWLRDGEPPLSGEDFRRSLSMAAVSVGPSGHLRISYQDGGMFWGHEVVISLFPDRSVAKIDLEG